MGRCRGHALQAEINPDASFWMIEEFAVQTYGKEILAEWVKTSRDYQRVFGVSPESFEQQWLKWLVKMYTET